ncbi:glutamine synthetase catalytic region [Actinobacteria bacterium OK074]|nr:glutamine synthetase catalytic region [Actinobacteria bacterium OK074]
MPDRAFTLLPSGLLTVDELKKAVGGRRVTTVLLGVPDLSGRLRGKRINARVFVQQAVGARGSGPVVAADPDMTPLNSTGLPWDTGLGELLVQPDLDTIRHLPHDPGTALVHGDLLHSDGTPVDAAPRQMLRDQIGRLRRLGFEVKAGLHSTMVLYHGTPQQLRAERYQFLRPVFSDADDHSLSHPQDLTACLDDLEQTLQDAAAPVESVSTYSTPGQIGFTFPHGEAMSVCDAHTVYRHAALAIAACRRMTPSFMAAPETGVVNGLHLRLSLWQNGHNAFAAPPDTPDPGRSLPDPLRNAVAGLICCLPHLAPLYAWGDNAYRRYLPYSFAPTNFSWGFDNRTCAVRIAGEGPGRHLEVRTAGADASPYLAATASLAAICHGLTEQPALPPSSEHDAYPDTRPRPVPRDLAEAVAAFEASTLARRALGKHVVEHYVQAARQEADHVRWQVPDIERMRGFDRA